ncbi:hypothetical protein K6Y31_21785 [Motilimonas cestriensis]|uniref:Uncharacterized protein n=1 Tax=Motilimonas cestriensis TaxID=2742685 RepID=A0ABS8WEC7_9GAMM|nr:hypothetical protein [Motilimonas cestriensis]MCE2597404.1 hypothetical protein [Motilimonas cestriensis]
MPTIKFTGPALVASVEENDDGSLDLISDKTTLESLNGLSYQDEEFSDYLYDREETEGFAEYVSGGILSFTYDSSSGALIGSIEYQLSRHLSADEVEALEEYTIEQLTDGIGSNFSQERALSGEVTPFINHEELSCHQAS